MILNKIHHIGIICSNYERSKYFYTNILELKIVKETYRQERNSYKLDLAIGNNYQIELFSFQKAPKRLSYPEGCGLRHLAFEVDNIEGVVEELKFKGIEVEKIRIDEITGKKFTFFEDPDELPIEIYEK
jgi:glyoxylase I family protein